METPKKRKMSIPEALVEGNPYRDDVFRTELDNGIVIDTCIGFDTGIWETGVLKPDLEWVIVQQYKSRSEAQEGHAEWVNSMKKNPTQELTDILWSKVWEQ